MKGIWENNEVKELFTVVEDFKLKNKSLREAFAAHAEKYGRKPNSVRNYYYHEVDNLKDDKIRLQKLGINLENHNKTSIVYFSQEEEEKLMEDIDVMVKNGVSVRKACFKLSGGDVGQMLRFQNKYRNYLIKTSSKSQQQKIVENDNVITFKKVKQRSLSDSEIQSLFMGLVRLVKKTALEESEEKFKNQILQANENLRNAILALNNKEKDYDKLKQEFIKMKFENNTLAEHILKLRCDKAENLRIKLQTEKE